MRIEGFCSKEDLSLRLQIRRMACIQDREGGNYLDLRLEPSAGVARRGPYTRYCWSKKTLGQVTANRLAGTMTTVALHGRLGTRPSMAFGAPQRFDSL